MALYTKKLSKEFETVKKKVRIPPEQTKALHTAPPLNHEALNDSVGRVLKSA